MKKALTFLFLFVTVVSMAQTSRFIGSYQYSEPEIAQSLVLFKNQRFNWQVVYGAYNLDLRGKWQIKNAKVYFESDKSNPARFDIYARYNPEISNGTVRLNFHELLINNSLVTTGKSYAATSFLPVRGTSISSGWYQQDRSVNKGDKLWIIAISGLTQIQEYPFDEKFNEYYISPNINNNGATQFLEDKTVELYGKKDIHVISKDPEFKKAIFKRTATELTTKEEKEFGEPYVQQAVEISGQLCQPLRVNRQFEDKTISVALLKENIKTVPKERKMSRNYTGAAKYSGNFGGKSELWTMKLSLKPEYNHFVEEIIVNDKQDVHYMEGTYKIKGDTAYLTSAPDFDEIKVYGRTNKKFDTSHLNLIFRGFEKNKVLFKSGPNYQQAGDFQRMEGVSVRKDTIFNVPIIKSDTLWIAYTDKQTHVYAYTFDNPLSESNNEIFIEPKPDDSGVMVDYAVYINEQGGVFMNKIKQPLMHRLPEETDELSDLATSPSMNPLINGKYFDKIERSGVFKLRP